MKNAFIPIASVAALLVILVPVAMAIAKAMHALTQALP